MDPLTHALIGAGVASLTGDKLSVSNPIQLGAVLGALAPDLDIILQLYGDMPYLTHHRGLSHSIPGVLFISAVIAGVLWLLFPAVHPGLVFVWSMLGAVSHIVLDILNSYGVKILWPFSQKKITLNLLVLVDPVIIAVFAVVMFLPGIAWAKAGTAFWLFLAYVVMRLYMRWKIYRVLCSKYSAQQTKKIVVMPAMFSLWNWWFLVETADAFIVGEVRCFSLIPGIKKVLNKSPQNELVQLALKSRLGKVFQNFTPHYYAFYYQEDDKHMVRFCDLRYFLRGDFLHHATFVFDEAKNLIDAVFQPYNKKRKIRILDKMTIDKHA
jgi:inner membrane protein